MVVVIRVCLETSKFKISVRVYRKKNENGNGGHKWKLMPSCVHNKHKLSQLDKTEKNLGNMLPFFSVHVRRRNTEATRSWWYKLKVTNQLIFCGFAVGQLLWASTVHSWVLSSLKTKIVKISFLAMWFLKSFQRAVLQSRATHSGKQRPLTAKKTIFLILGFKS